ncbi:MAG TPA: GYD domain-containing protein [Candidatus Cybelea sp.]|nr:GYD domain-containing protein [Candidatus Cybelea sp.]
MPLYLTQLTYTAEAWNALVRNPQDRFEAVRPAIEKLGGKIVSGYFAFGDYDVIVIAEMPNNVSAAAFAMAIAAGGACKSYKTTPLMTTAEAIEALNKAAQSPYRPAARTVAAG